MCVKLAHKTSLYTKATTKTAMKENRKKTRAKLRRQCPSSLPRLPTFNLMLPFRGTALSSTKPRVMSLYSLNAGLYSRCMVNRKGLWAGLRSVACRITLLSMLCILQKRISSGICLLLPSCPPHNTVGAASRSPSNPDTVPEEAGLKELQEKQPHSKMAVLVGSACDRVVSPKD